MIQLNNVSVSYLDNIWAVKDISFKVKKGELVVLIGPSGCGKTTTLKLLNGMLLPTKGEVNINGTDIRKLDLIKLRRSLGYVPQNSSLFPYLNVIENIRLPYKLAEQPSDMFDKRLSEAMSLLNLPESFYTKKPSELSGGERQRVAIARALVCDPTYMLMDEPFSALDPPTRSVLQNEIMSIHLKLGNTIIFVTHDIDEALKIADRIILFKDSQIEQDDSPTNFILHPKSEFVTKFLKLEQEYPHLHKLSWRAVALELMFKHAVDKVYITDDDESVMGYVTKDIIVSSLKDNPDNWVYLTELLVKE